MTDEQSTSSQSTEKAPEPAPTKTTPLTEGQQPEPLVKGHQPVEFSQQPADQIFTGGYKPVMATSTPLNPPQGGSGVPPVQSNADSDKSSDAKD